MAGAKTTALCGKLFSTLNILATASEFLFLVLSSILTNTEKFQTNSHTCNISTMHLNNLHVQALNSIKYQKRVHYAGTKLHIRTHVFSNPPQTTNI